MTSKRAILVMSVLGFLAVTLSAQTPTPQPPTVVRDPNVGVMGGGGYGGGFGGSGFAPVGGEWTSNPFGMAYGQTAEEVQLARQCDSLVKQLAKAEGADKDKVKAKLSESVDKQFDLRQKRHETEITALENQLKKLREMVQKRQENRKDIVGKRLEQLVRESEGLGW